MITIIAALSYFAMALGTGFRFNYIAIRQVYWARYVDWTLTTPLILLDLSLLAGMSGANILIAVLADVIMCLTGLFATFSHEDNGKKWGWYVSLSDSVPGNVNQSNNLLRYAIACIAYLIIVWQLVVNGRAAARTKGSKVFTFFTAILGYTLLVWTAYPV